MIPRLVYIYRSKQRILLVSKGYISETYIFSIQSNVTTEIFLMYSIQIFYDIYMSMYVCIYVCTTLKIIIITLLRQ